MAFHYGQFFYVRLLIVLFRVRIERPAKMP